MIPVRLAIAILAMVTLTSCDQLHHDTQPACFIEITMVPAETASEGFRVSTSGTGFYEWVEQTDGNLALLEPPVGDQWWVWAVVGPCSGVAPRGRSRASMAPSPCA